MSAEIEEACELLAQSSRVSVLEFLSLRSKLLTGEWRALVTRSPEGAAVLVSGGATGFRQVMVGHGTAAELVTALKKLRDESDGLIWDDGVVPLEAGALDELGFFMVERQSFTQDLTRVPLDEPPPAGLEVAVLTEADLPAARHVFAITHVMNVAGLYTTFPHAPTLERCAHEFDDYLAGGQGEAVPSACLVTKLEGKVVGVICCSKTDDPDMGALLGLGVDPSVRGKGLSRVLVRGAQRALKQAGFSKMLFATTDGNLPVHRLFTPEEILETETWRVRLWLRNAPERGVKPR